MVTISKSQKSRNMWGFKAILVGFLGVMLLGGLGQANASPSKIDAKERSVPGTIAMVDVKAGILQLEGVPSENRRYPTEFRINAEATLVHDPTDTKFLALKDLKVGQHVTVQFDWTQEEWKSPAIARKIIAEPMPEVYREATGQVAEIDGQAGTLIIEQKLLGAEGGSGNLFYFVFEPKELVVMRAPSTEPVQLVLKQGDTITVVFVVRDGMRHVHSITLLSPAPETTSTTTTTTTTSTRKIIVEPTPVASIQEATGELEAIDAQAGTLVIQQKPLPNVVGENNLFFFVFEPKSVLVMRAPSTDPVQLLLNPGDVVKVEYMVQDGKRFARSITLISSAPDTTSSTNTTTTKTTTTTVR